MDETFSPRRGWPNGRAMHDTHQPDPQLLDSTDGYFRLEASPKAHDGVFVARHVGTVSEGFWSMRPHVENPNSHAADVMPSAER